MEREKKHESILVAFCIILAWIYGKLPKIPKITKKCPDCDIHGLWLKDAFKNDQYLHFIRSFLSNWYDVIFFVVLNLSFCSCPYLFSSRKLWSPKSNESQYICSSQVNIITGTLNLRFLILRKKLKTNHRIRFCSRKFKLPVYYPMICFKFSRKIRKLILELRDSEQSWMKSFEWSEVKSFLSDVLWLDLTFKFPGESLPQGSPVRCINNNNN